VPDEAIDSDRGARGRESSGSGSGHGSSNNGIVPFGRGMGATRDGAARAGGRWLAN